MQETQILSDGLQSRSFNIPRYRLTKLGEQMARLPIDPKIARILLAAKKHDCMAEILVIASALSIQDPHERPLEARDAAAKAHERFTDKQSDFLAYLNIWDSFQRERDKGLSNKQLMQWCRQYFLSHLRMREWRELHHQLAQTAIEMGLTTKEAAFRRPPEVRQLTSSENAGDQDLSAKLKQKQLDKKQHRAQIRAAKEAGYEQIHRALLTGLIANVGMKSPDGNDYTGARGSRFHLFPASALFKAKPKWVMAAELVETTKLYARDVAAIQPEWIEQEAPHLVRYHYFEPHWEQKRGEVIASERVTLYGLTVLPRRPVSYGRIAPEEAREIFIRSALVAQECDLKADFFVHNKKLIKEITELEHKSRKQDVLVDDEALFAFYHERLPNFYTADAVSDCLHPANPQQTALSPAGEGWGEGKTVATQTNFSATAANPLPNPLPQEREQSAAVSTVSGSLKTMSCEARLNFCEAKTKTESSLHSQRLPENHTPPFSDDLHPTNLQRPSPSPPPPRTQPPETTPPPPPAAHSSNRASPRRPRPPPPHPRHRGQRAPRPTTTTTPPDHPTSSEDPPPATPLTTERHQPTDPTSTRQDQANKNLTTHSTAPWEPLGDPTVIFTARPANQQRTVRTVRC